MIEGKQFCDQLTKIMKQKGVTSAQLARWSGVMPCSITYYRQGKRNPTIKTRIRLADALNVPYEALSGDESPDMSERKRCAKRLNDLADLCLLSEKYKILLRRAAELLVKGEQT